MKLLALKFRLMYEVFGDNLISSTFVCGVGQVVESAFDKPEAVG